MADVSAKLREDWRANCRLLRLQMENDGRSDADARVTLPLAEFEALLDRIEALEAERLYCIGDGRGANGSHNGCGVHGGLRSGDTCRKCNGMVLSESALATARRAAAGWGLIDD